MSRVPIRLESKSKYRNTRSNGFDSKREERRFRELLLLQKAGKIEALKTQYEFPLTVNSVPICSYVADFFYVEHTENGRDVDVIEDAKGYRTREYRIKKKLVKALYGIDIRES